MVQVHIYPCDQVRKPDTMYGFYSDHCYDFIHDYLVLIDVGEIIIEQVVLDCIQGGVRLMGLVEIA